MTWIRDVTTIICWLTHAKNWNFDWKFSVRRRVPKSKRTECTKTTYAFVRYRMTQDFKSILQINAAGLNGSITH
jgi:hypothetical protein